MYAIAGPRARQAWRQVLEWVTERAGVPMRIIDHDPPALLSSLWARDDLGAAQMCGLPMALRSPMPTVLAAPIPEHPRYGGHAVYFSDIIVAADSKAQRIEDTFGGTVGYTLADSMSGCVALRLHLERYRTRERARLYARVVGDLIHVRGMIEAVSAKRVDVGAVDSYLFDLIGKHDPAIAARVRRIGTTDAAPMPPFVATAVLDHERVQRLREAFCEAGSSHLLAGARGELLLAGFAAPQAADYEVFHRIQEISERHAGIW